MSTAGVTQTVIGFVCSSFISIAIIVHCIRQSNDDKSKSLRALTFIALVAYLVHASAVSLMHFDDIYSQDRFFCSWFVRYVLHCSYITFTFIQLLNSDTNTNYTMQKQRHCSSLSFYPMLLLHGADYSSSYLIQALCSSIQQQIDCISLRYGVYMVCCLSNR